MVFSSLLFLFYFLPIILTFYFLAPRKYKNLTLLIFSLLFYSWGEPKYILIMIFSSILDYTCGRMIHKNKLQNKLNIAKNWLILSISINLFLLGFFKYSNFFLENLNNIFNLDINLLSITLPIGISFYTFQTMSYTIDVYRGETDVQKHFISFALYVSLFPQLIAGPIVKYKTIAEELDNRKESFYLFGRGVKRFIIGLGKKVLIANNVGLVWNNILNMGNSNITTLSAWIGIIAFALQIYFDFSGYSDMAIGLGNMFGFNFNENFNYPYISKTITEFWRRWHISLGSWFREYLYIPLGGNRVSKIKNIRNIIIVWMLTGIWHGASWNFVIWGLYFGVILILEKFIYGKYLKNLPVFIQRIYTLFLVLMSWVIFAIDDFSDVINYIVIMYNPNINGLYDNTSLYYIYTNIILFLVAFIASTKLPIKVWKRINSNKNHSNIEITLLLAVLILVIANLVDQTYNPFLYFRF